MPANIDLGDNYSIEEDNNGDLIIVDGDGTAILTHDDGADEWDFIDPVASAVIDGNSSPFATDTHDNTQHSTNYATDPHDNTQHSVTFAALNSNGTLKLSQTPEISSYVPGHTEWEAGLSSEEVHRVAVGSNETFVLTRSSFRQKGGGSSTSADVTTAVSGGNTLQTTTLGSTDADLSDTVSGPATVLINLTNSTGGEIEAAPEVNWRIE